MTCKTNTLSTIFGRKNIVTFLATAGIFCFIQAVLFHYSAVDPMVSTSEAPSENVNVFLQTLKERLNRSKDILDELSLDNFELRLDFGQGGATTQRTPSPGGHFNDDHEREMNTAGTHGASPQAQMGLQQGGAGGYRTVGFGFLFGISHVGITCIASVLDQRFRNRLFAESDVLPFLRHIHHF